MMAALAKGGDKGGDKSGDKLQRAFNTRHATAERERANPPPMIKKVNFCNAAAAAFPSSGMEQQ